MRETLNQWLVKLNKEKRERPLHKILQIFDWNKRIRYCQITLELVQKLPEDDFSSYGISASSEFISRMQAIDNSFVEIKAMLDNFKKKKN